VRASRDNMTRFSLRRFSVALRRLSPTDRIALGVAILYVILKVIGAFGHPVPLTSFAGFLTFLAVIYFFIRLLPWIRTSLLCVCATAWSWPIYSSPSFL